MPRCCSTRRCSGRPSRSRTTWWRSCFCFLAFIVGVFYCLEALHGERRDRTILFWKSLPVSDLTTVLSKASIPLVVLPLVTFTITIGVQLVMLLMSNAALVMSGMSATTSAQLPLLPRWAMLLYGVCRDGALARADLRLAAAGLGLGAARGVSLGVPAADCDPDLREDRIRHVVFRRFPEPSLHGLAVGGLRARRRVT